MLVRFVAVAGAFALLAACSHAPEPPPGGPGGPMGPGGISSSRFGPGSQQDLAASAGDRVFFDYDQSDISPEGQQILRKQAEWLRRYPNVSVTIEGHCDERGTREYNLALGERRISFAHARKKRPRLLLEPVLVFLPMPVLRFLVAAARPFHAGGYIGIHEHGEIGLQIITQNPV